ncbi:MAG TPA: HlyD family efflux transporter periplasmic adaptor subunit [Thermoanaerobaculia bacterium]|nr:HlyD family efflux transporter periplasmic adaptor subunit [Thermoanaerobaculia bacterium]
MKRRLALAALGLAALAALAATLPSAARLGRAGAPGAPDRGMVAGGGVGGVGGGGGGDVPVAAVARRDFVHLVPAEGNLRAVRSTAVLVPAAAPGSFRLAWLAPDGSRVRAGEVVARFDPTDIEKALADAEGDLATSRLKAGKQRATDLAEIYKLERDAAMARIELEQAKRFQKKDTLIFSRNDIIESGIDQELAAQKEQHARRVQASRQELQRADVGVLGVDIRQAELKIRQAREGLRALQVRAPNDGVLILKRDQRLEVPHVGDQVWTGSTLAEVPEPAAMEAEVYVLEADAGGLAAGRPATVAVESAPGVEHAARIARVDALAKPRLRGSPVQFFAVTLQLDRTDPRVMKPGQRVQATLRLAERRDALVVPRQAVFQRDGHDVVYRRRAGGGFDAVPVTLGPADLATTVLDSGVAAGDLLALRDPTGAGRSRGAAAGAAGAAAAAPRVPRIGPPPAEVGLP